jgi:hypothetical protein
MPKTVHITAPIDPLEVRIERLRIPKARQRRIRAMMDEARARLASQELDVSFALSGRVDAGDSTEPERKLQNASAAD